jgi:hypothetical protein
MLVGRVKAAAAQKTQQTYLPTLSFSPIAHVAHQANISL